MCAVAHVLTLFAVLFIISLRRFSNVLKTCSCCVHNKTGEEVVCNRFK